MLGPRSSHLSFLTSTLHAHLFLNDRVLALLLKSHSRERFLFFVANALLDCTPLFLSICLFLLGVLNVALQSIDSVLQLLHVLASLLHLLLLFEH